VTTSTGRRLSSASAHHSSPCSGWVLGDHRGARGVRPREVVAGLGHAPVAVGDRAAQLLAPPALEHGREASPDRIGARCEDAVPHEVVDRGDEVVRHAGDELDRHASSIARRIAAFSEDHLLMA